MALAAIKKFGGNSNAKLKIRMHPFPLTYQEQLSATDATISGMLIVFYLGIGVSFIPALVTNFIVLETETEIKH